MSILISPVHHHHVTQCDRTDWRYERVTTPRESWRDGDEGMKRRIRRIIERLLIGDEVELPDGRRVGRDAMYDYTIWRNAFTVETKVRGKKAIIHYLTGYSEPIAEPTTPPRRKSKYHHVYYIYREKAWRAELQMNNKNVYIGWSKSEEEAARLYDAYVIAHGIDRPLNFPLEQQEAA